MTHIRPGRDSKPVPSSFEPQLDRMSHRGRPILYCQQLASPAEWVLIKKIIARNMPHIKVLLTVYMLTTFYSFFCTFFMRRKSVICNNSSTGDSSSHYYPTNLNSLGHGICVQQENISAAEGPEPGTPGL